MPAMRTTLTIEDDLAQKLKVSAARQRKSFKEVVNQALRRGLDPQGRLSANHIIKLKTKKLEYRKGVDEVKLKELLDELDVEDSVKS